MRKYRNQVRSMLKEDDVEVEDPKEMKALAKYYFQHLIGKHENVVSFLELPNLP